MNNKLWHRILERCKVLQDRILKTGSTSFLFTFQYLPPPSWPYSQIKKIDFPTLLFRPSCLVVTTEHLLTVVSMYIRWLRIRSLYKAYYCWVCVCAYFTSDHTSAARWGADSRVMSSGPHTKCVKKKKTMGMDVQRDNFISWTIAKSTLL